MEDYFVRYDFYLVPQCVRQGTVTPVSYNVIYDDSGLKPDHMQRLAYKMCHLYYNWQGTVRVPAPCQYAHKLAFLVGQSLHKTPDEKLADKLFFLWNRTVEYTVVMSKHWLVIWFCFCRFNVRTYVRRSFSFVLVFHCDGVKSVLKDFVRSVILAVFILLKKKCLDVFE